MKILLVGINAKYVQTNLAIRLLRAYALEHSGAAKSGSIEVSFAEWNINLPLSNVVRGVYESRADMVLFSTYIWNREFVLKACSEIRQVCPQMIVGVGGPEVSWSAGNIFRECPAVDLVMAGEGEQTFSELVSRFAGSRDFSDIRGLYVRNGTDFSWGGERTPISDLGTIPFPYSAALMDFDPANRIVYYESSRGCPFSCAYCLSSIDKSVRYYPLERVLREIGYFMEAGFPLVKFVDRTFNLDPERYLAIWKYIRDHHNGKTLFHFEIAAECLSEDSFAVLETMPEGSIQFEIGIQSVNPETLRQVGRSANPKTLAEKIRRIPSGIHTHVDLIAGLPAEDIASFASSFNYAFSLNAEMLQLGFLKILSGTPMEAIARSMSGYRWSSFPPYEVFSSPDLPYGDLLVLKDVEQIVDTWYNSALLRNTLNQLVAIRPDSSPFSLFREISSFVREYYPDGDLYLPRRPADHFACLAAFIDRKFASRGTPDAKILKEWLKYDYLLQGKPGVYPAWYNRNYSREAHDEALCSQGLTVSGESRRTLYARTEYERFAFGPGEEMTALFFVYAGTKKDERKAVCIRL